MQCICDKRGCIHYIGLHTKEGTEAEQYHYCKAFPNGIPNEILSGKNKHSKVLKGQVGDYVFKNLKK